MWSTFVWRTHQSSSPFVATLLSFAFFPLSVLKCVPKWSFLLCLFKLDEMNYMWLNFDVVNPPVLYMATLLSFAFATKNTKKLWITFLLILEKGFSEPKYSFWFYGFGTTYVLPGSVNSIKMHACNHEYAQKNIEARRGAKLGFLHFGNPGNPGNLGNLGNP